jgi:hypothetical protein
MPSFFNQFWMSRRANTDLVDLWRHVRSHALILIFKLEVSSFLRYSIYIIWCFWFDLIRLPSLLQNEVRVNKTSGVSMYLFLMVTYSSFHRWGFNRHYSSTTFHGTSFHGKHGVLKLHQFI